MDEPLCKSTFYYYFYYAYWFNFTKKILAWYDNSKEICLGVLAKSHLKSSIMAVSEFMPQMIKTVIPYFNNFIKRFNSLNALSKSNENKF